VEGKFQFRVFGEDSDKRLIGQGVSVFKDMVEITHRLVVMDSKDKIHKGILF
jgi:hypothetical protein